MGQGANAVPATRIIQGVVGHAVDRRGKRHLVDGILDYVDNWLLSLVGMGVVAGDRAPASVQALVSQLKKNGLSQAFLPFPAFAPLQLFQRLRQNGR